METIESLRKKGIKVRVSHYRYPILKTSQSNIFGKELVFILAKEGLLLLESDIRKFGLSFNPKGGRTELLITKNGIDYLVTSRCKKTDSYNKKTGVQLALDKINL
jgi:hypothetical protein